VAFWLRPGEESVEQMASRVCGPHDSIPPQQSSLEDRWGRGRAVTSDSQHAEFCCAVFCRRVHERKFMWRYPITSGSDASVFDMIPEMPDRFQHFGQSNRLYGRSR
jgi:hypothetical protein